MKASDLMIGDYIRFRGNIGRVCAIFKDCDIDSDYKAIPITEEILKANGFENYKNIGSLRYYKNTDKLLKFEFYGKTLEDYAGSRIIEIGFVHEFQNALRLMGQTELADNFKIV